MSWTFCGKSETTVISYIDTSSIVRRLVDDGPPLDSWGTWDGAVASEVGRIEVHRTVARLLHERRLTDETAATVLQHFEEISAGILWVPLNERVAEIAAKESRDRKSEKRQDAQPIPVLCAARHLAAGWLRRP